jgi:uncharacterized protein YjbI with pentapeptide repeats
MTVPNEWQRECTAAFRECVERDPWGPTAWAQKVPELTAKANATIEDPQRRRIIIADCDLRGRDLRSFSFKFIYFARVDFTGADLSKAVFDRSILSGCRMVRSDLRGAKFLRTKIDSDTIGWDAIWDRTTELKFMGGTESLVGFEPSFRFKADEDSRIADYLARKTNSAFRFILEWLDFGRSVRRLLGAVGIVAVVCGAFYWVLEKLQWVVFEGEGHTIADFILMSGQRLINANPTFGTASFFGQCLFFMEAAIGYGALALLSAVILRKFILFR